MTSASAPGRVELLGNHTDYNEGVVLAGAIDRRVTLTGEQLSDDFIQLHSPAMERAVRVALDDLQPLTDDRWANYSLGVVREFQKAGLPVSGFAAEITSTLPPGGGLSSSAALEIATAYFLLRLNGHTLPPLELAQLCRRAENNFVGVPSGLLDQVSSVFGRANELVFLDCRTEEVQTIPFPQGLELIITDSGTKHQLVEGRYRQRREECQAAARLLHVEALRDVTWELLEATPLEPILHRRAAHIIGENQRVWQAVELLASNDGAAFGRLMNESHQSSRQNFDNSIAELDILVKEAQKLPGVLGARLTGGGFGGCTVTLVESSRASEIVQSLADRYHARTGIWTSPTLCRLADGACRL